MSDSQHAAWLRRLNKDRPPSAWQRVWEFLTKPAFWWMMLLFILALSGVIDVLSKVISK